MSWTPEQGFGPDSWNRYCEGLILLLLAIDAPNGAIPADPHIVWVNWNRNFLEYDPGDILNNFPVYMHTGPLFAHQFPQLWLDFRAKEANDGALYWGENYFKNSVIASLINRHYCERLNELDSTNYKDYRLNCWGLSSCHASQGYMFLQPLTTDPNGNTDSGTLNPWMPAGSVVFTPRESTATLQYIYDTYPQFWSTYGFYNSFNTGQALSGLPWSNPRVVGVDNAGPAAISIENYRTGLVWEKFMQVPEIQSAMGLVNFVEINVPDHDDFNDAGQTAWNGGYGAWGGAEIEYEEIPYYNQYVNGKAIVVENPAPVADNDSRDRVGGWLGLAHDLHYNDQSTRDTLSIWFRTEPPGFTFYVGLKDIRNNEKLIPLRQGLMHKVPVMRKEGDRTVVPQWQNARIPLSNFSNVYYTDLDNISIQMDGATVGKVYVDNAAFIVNRAGVDAPQNLRVTKEGYAENSSKAVISWAPVEGAAGYRGYVSKFNGEDYILVYAGSDTQFSHPVDNTANYFVITAVDAEGRESDFSKQASTE
jgi:hypothetical protein